MIFDMTEDNLTDAIFNNGTLETNGAGTKAEARIQARKMLTADEMLMACRAALEVFIAEGIRPNTHHGKTYCDLHNAIEKATKGN